MDTTEKPAAADVPIVRGWKRIVYLLAGGFFFLLGALGAFLPGLPATPFLMLASYFLVRTSPRAHQALLKSRLFGPILIDWQTNGGVRRHIKQKATIFVILTVGISIWLTGQSQIAVLCICSLAAIGLIVVWRLPDVRR